MNNEEIKKYVADERARGVRDEDIKKELITKGWKEGDVQSVMGMGGPVPGSAPIPTGVLMSAGDLLSLSFNELKERIALIAQIMAFPVGCYVISAVMLTAAKSHPGGMYSTSFLPMILSLVGAVLSVFASIGIMKQIRSSWSLSVGDTYRVATPYFWSMVWVSILTGFAVLGGTILLVIPGIIVAIMLSFTRPAVVLDDIKGMAALSWSGELVSGIWGGIFWRLFVMGLLVFLVSLLFNLLPYIGAISALFTTPFALIYMVRLYENVKAHKGILPAQSVGKNRGMYMTLAILGALVIPVILLVGIGLGLMNAFGGGMPNNYPDTNPTSYNYNDATGNVSNPAYPLPTE